MTTRPPDGASPRETLERIYWSLRGRIAPGLTYAHHVYEDALRAWVPAGSRWLDVGCGRHLLPSWRRNHEAQLVAAARTVVGVDADMASLRDHQGFARKVRGEIAHLPFADGRFDIVTANMVVEHLRDPAAQFREIARVLAPGGVFLFHTPNALGYVTVCARMIPGALKTGLAWVLEQRREEDLFPTHYRANTKGTIRRLARDAGFEIAHFQPIPSDAALLVVPPLAALELVWIRLTMTRALAPLRTNLIVALRKPAT